MESVEGTIINENDINSGGCKKCQQKKGTSMKQIVSIVVGTYVLFASIYGTIVIINKIIDLFN
jgi:hypothetical protein